MTFQHLAVRPRLDALTGARGPAALMVFAQHAGESGFLPFVVPSSLAVSFFFILSGFVLAYAYFNDRSFGLPFYKARFARIWPSTMLSIVLVLLILPRQVYLPQQLDECFSGLVFLTNVLLLQSIIPIPDFYFALNAVAWSISVECCFYLVFPALNRLLKLHGFRALLLVALIGFLLTGFSLQLRWPAFDASVLAQPTWHGVVYINPVTRLFEFSLGVLAGQLWIKTDRCLSKKKITSFLHFEMKAWLISLVEILMIIGLIFLLYQSAQFFSGYETSYFAPFYLLLIQWGSSLPLLFIIVLLAGRQGFFTQFIMCHPIMLRLGELSFGIYLFHQPLMRWLQSNLYSATSDAGLIKAVPEWSYVFVLLFITICLSVFSHDYLVPKVKRLIISKR